ncbi:MAG: EamA family transporter [Desulfobacter sp.]|nr:MAG: EamA family transporter [Desulfobacter sp.]
MKKNYAAILLLMAAAVCWSTSGILIKMVSLHPLAIAGWRSLIAGVFIVAVCRKSVDVTWDRYTLGAAFCLGAFCICFVGATKLSTAANAIVLQYSASAYVAVLAPWVLKEETRAIDWVTLVLVVAGVCLFFMDDLSMEGRWGIFLGILGALLFAGTMLFLRKNKDGSTAWPLGLGNFFAAVCCLPFMFGQMPGITDGLGLLGLGVVSIGAGYAIFSYAIKNVPALEAVLVCSIEPFINPLWVFLFLGELPGPSALAGGSLVLVAVTSRSVLSAVNMPSQPGKA